MTESCVMQTPNKYMDCAILKKEYTVSTSKSLGNRFTIKNINGDSALLTCTNRFKRKKKKSRMCCYQIYTEKDSKIKCHFGSSVIKSVCVEMKG